MLRCPTTRTAGSTTSPPKTGESRKIFHLTPQPAGLGNIEGFQAEKAEPATEKTDRLRDDTSEPTLGETQCAACLSLKNTLGNHVGFYWQSFFVRCEFVPKSTNKGVGNSPRVSGAHIPVIRKIIRRRGGS